METTGVCPENLFIQHLCRELSKSSSFVIVVLTVAEIEQILRGRDYLLQPKVHMPKGGAVHTFHSIFHGPTPSDHHAMALFQNQSNIAVNNHSLGVSDLSLQLPVSQ